MNIDPGEEPIQIIQENTRIHNQVHQQYPHIRDISQAHKDISCSICHPINRNFSPQFLIFWDWVQETHQAIGCTSETVTTFEQILLEQDPVQLIQFVRILFLSIRYRIYPRSLNIIVRNYFLAARRTHHFGIALDEVPQSSPEPTTEDNPSESSNSIIARDSNSDSNSDSDTDSNSDSEESTLGLGQLFNQPINQNQNQIVNMNQQDLQNLTDALNQVFNAIHPVPAAVPELNNVKYPEYYGGNQDPITWLEEMEQAFVTNRVANDRRLAVTVPRLKGGAATWWTQVRGIIDRWNDATDNNTIAASFVPNFQTRYRTRAMEEGWAAELEK